MDELTRRHAMWVARAMACTDRSPLSAQDILALEESCTPRRADAGTILISAGEVPTTVYIVREGVVHLAIRTPTVGRQTIGLVQSGGVVGDVQVFLDQESPYDVIADTDVTVLAVTRERLLAMLATSPSLSMRWTTSVAQRTEAVQRRLVTLLTKDLAAQIATLLIDHRSLEDGVWLVRMPHQTIAHLLGARRQSVSRVLGQMRREGLVRSRYGAVELLDVGGVSALAGMGDVEEGISVSA